MPQGSSASGVSLPMRPLATSRTVPSPPRAITRPCPARAAAFASSTACPAYSLIASVKSAPLRASSSRTRTNTARAAPLPATGFQMMCTKDKSAPPPAAVRARPGGQRLPAGGENLVIIIP